ncbi:hypothetical protein [Lactobacillus amylovorus]|uniref:hypothetical protein n=1 Tax=Lactobacillus amylovorus TaxID=1604 RepID=UPI00232F7F83|nr:hypothetical protein [Lactobacillus amylovorus]MDB6263636.1 hypothetical protein [Lactobacillus amylovorus]
MAIDHLVFNKLKWFNVADNSEVVQANDKRYVAIPTKVQFNTSYSFEPGVDSPVYSKVKWSYPDVQSLQGLYVFSQGEQAACIGTDGDYYILKDVYNHDSTVNGNLVAAVKKDLLLPIWGGKALLSHLYQWFGSLYRMVAIAC